MFRNLINTMALAASKSIFDKLLSKTAVLIYIVAILLVIGILILVAMMSSSKNKTVTVLGTAGKPLTVTPAAKAKSEAVSADGTLAEEAEDDAASEEELRDRFCMLSIIDSKEKEILSRPHDKGITLKRFCTDFRNYASYKLKLYYDISDIRRFIAGLAVSQVIIFQGMSGTGKTSLAHALGSFLDNPSTVIPVQPMWKERTDLLGYYNEFTKKFNETTLLHKMYEANYGKSIYVTILDELNIARVEYYFAEFLSMLELPDPEERYIDVVSDVWETDPKKLRDGKIKLPKNMWFIGTANNDDSTFAISDKVYDRAMLLNLDSKCESFTAPKTEKIRLAEEDFRRLVSDALSEYSITKRNLSRLTKLDAYLIKHFRITFGNRIMKQINQYIPVFVACGGTELEALDDIISKKIIRKLETQNPVHLRSAADGLISYIEDLFGAEKMPLCIEAIKRLKNNA